MLIRTQGNEQLDLAQADIGIFNTVAQADVLADWNDILGKDYLEANFEQSALDVGNIDGKQLGLPWSMASITMVYNPEILKAAGWDAPPTTIENSKSALAISRQLTLMLSPMPFLPKTQLVLATLCLGCGRLAEQFSMMMVVLQSIAMLQLNA